MKKLIQTFLVVSAFVLLPIALSAQTPPHPNGGGGPGSGNTPVGGGAPIGGGLIIMLVSALAYGTKKTFYKKDIKF
jgi:hypothetical protein